ncbi:hypothetical protein [Pseudomonas fluorescens]|uniref:hypothetical protein n=1 Tax=Pseudomonas fluorescens TaxID=294 RepID=UPI0003730DE4|nr:hypothetical protein [Pseudomonas fluorescens]
MILHLSLSRQGTHRAENRDFSGSAHNSGAQLYVITDGASKSGTLCPDFPVAATSNLVLLVFDQTAVTLHAGDCCLGYLESNQPVNWLSSPHCGPNWKGNLSHALIASSPARKKLLNCMSYRRSHEPAFQVIQVLPDTTWILATDGFWAELPAEHQLDAITQRSFEGYSTEDDATFMLLKT